ncbi:MAG: 50S ribosomal protein L6 [Euryarchaeota archaeon]|nr:50S ribosomal protein L6 [Euryarchaeota archaeon]
MATAEIIEEIVDIPDGVEVKIERNKVFVNGPKGQLERELPIAGITLEKQNKKILFRCVNPRRPQRALLRTIKAHIQNMIKGVTKGFEYKLKIVYAHFPISVKVSGNKITIENFLGEKRTRFAEIVGKTEVKVSGNIVSVRGIDKETVGQTSANIEQATRIRRRDPRVFQDGVFLVERDGVPV